MLRNGHLPGHVRDTFLHAIDAYCYWEEGTPEPTVEFEVRYVPHQINLREACGLVWNCGDSLPSDAANTLECCGIKLHRRTYAAAARALRPRISEDLAA
jgi:hypothetical protein